ncbi:hypothetical protein LSAT2_001437 [Lamellibrachia satsuma]|nr:hypothetical protein LSAT2_001437 [Lamellibrachia satsuma]
MNVSSQWRITLCSRKNMEQISCEPVQKTLDEYAASDQQLYGQNLRVMVTGIASRHHCLYQPTHCHPAHNSHMVQHVQHLEMGQIKCLSIMIRAMMALVAQVCLQLYHRES